MEKQHIIHRTRLELADTLEEIGSAVCLLREAAEAHNGGMEKAARLAAEDVVEILSTLELRYSQLSAQLSLWLA